MLLMLPSLPLPFLSNILEEQKNIEEIGNSYGQLEHRHLILLTDDVTSFSSDELNESEDVLSTEEASNPCEANNLF